MQHFCPKFEFHSLTCHRKILNSNSSNNFLTFSILAAGFLLYRIHHVNKKMESSDIMAASVRDKKKSKEKNKVHQKDAKHKGSQESGKTKPSGYERVK